MQVETKVCSKCKRELPATIDYFYKQEKNKDGLRSNCKSCDKEYHEKNKVRITKRAKEHYENNKKRINSENKKYREENRDKIITQRAKNYEVNKDKILAQNRKWCDNNKEQKTTYNKKWREEHRNEKCVYDKEYYEKNKEVVKKNAAEYRDANNEKIIESKRTYYQNNRQNIIKQNSLYHKDNKEKYIIIGQKRRAKKRQLPSTLTIQQWACIKQHFNNQCAYCGKGAPLDQEHFIPLTKNGEYALTNIIPACRNCNCSKRTQEFFYWYPRQPFYSKSREQKILTYLGYKNGIQQLSILS
jgi:hypothetical protein